MRLGLITTQALLAETGNPQLGMPGALVAGTNGKGSVCALAAAMAQAGGHRVALLTKPHLTSYRERIRLGSELISESEFAKLADQVIEAAPRLGAAGSPTHHELLTAMGFLAARQWQADLVICEVGLGGRLDASNAWDGGISVIVSVGLDHQKQLGRTLAEIAREKAAIIKPGNLALTGASGRPLAEVELAAARAPASLWRLGSEIEVRDGPDGMSVATPMRAVGGLRLAAAGRFQRGNAGLAVAVADGLGQLGFPVADRDIRSALAEARWPGRLETVARSPQVVVDAAHNPAAVRAVLPELKRLAEGRRAVLLFGSMLDHDHATMLRVLRRLPVEVLVATRAASARAAAPADLLTEWGAAGRRLEPVEAALQTARELAGAGGVVICLGSIYVVGEVMAALGIGVPPDPPVPNAPLW